MSKRRKPSQRAGPRQGVEKGTNTGAAARRYTAGCGREWEVASSAPDLAYTEQAFADCPACPHRVEPDGGAPPFCTLRPVGSPHPFAGLAGLL